MSFRHFARRRAWWLAALVFGCCGRVSATGQAERPNVVLILADDQGYGDVGWHGNPILKTPHLDALAREGVELRRFYVSPVCAPTRASLLTGRYNYRTRVVDTYQGRAMMDPDEVTLAEYLAQAGYRCGIFGKWHLGDNYPMRPADQGFHESLVHRGGGIGQASDPPGGSSYFNPILSRDGVLEKTEGYCSDVYTDAAIRFVDAHKGGPFFVYLAFNAPHVPLEVPQAAFEPYMKEDLNAVTFAAADPKTPRSRTLETTARVYGMVANIDANVGRLVRHLRQLGLEENTLILFMTDNGPQQARFNAGLRGLKGSVFEGGIRSVGVLRWPGTLEKGKTIVAPVAHIDITPTILDACGVAPANGPKLDGRSVWPLVTGRVAELSERPFFTQWHRGNRPEPGKACAVVTERWKLLQPQGVPEGSPLPEDGWMLFDLEEDPFEKHDLAAQHPQRVAEMKRMYDAWFADVSATRGYDPPRIVIDSAHENPTFLTRQDWRMPDRPQSASDTGLWELAIANDGALDVTLRFDPKPKPGQAWLELGGTTLSKPIAAGQASVVFERVSAAKGDANLKAWVERAAVPPAPSTRLGAASVKIEAATTIQGRK